MFVYVCNHLKPLLYYISFWKLVNTTCSDINCANDFAACLLFCFKHELLRAAYLQELQIMFSKLTLIISDPGEGRALSLPAIKAMELP